MEKITLEEFMEFYRSYGFCKGDTYRRKNPYTPSQLKTRYKKYIRKLEKQEEKQEEDKITYVDIKNQVYTRDTNRCRLYNKLSPYQQIEVSELLSSDQFGTLDIAHVFSRGVYPHMKYDVDNMVLLYRLFHSRLDAHLNPITGKYIANEELEDWWKLIIGNTLYEKLRDRSKR